MGISADSICSRRLILLWPAARYRAVNAIKIYRKPEMVQNAARKSFPLRRRQIDPQSGLPHLFEGRVNPGIRLASEKAAFAVVLTIRRRCFADPVVSERLQQNPHHVIERRPDRGPDIERFVRFMAKRT